jgi:amidase
MSETLWGRGAAELASAIEKREVTSREVVEEHLARIEDVNGSLNAVTVVLADEALAAADEADRRLAENGPSGPLHGVPFTVKENIDLAGSATTNGVVAFAQAVPPVDAPHVARVKAAGAIPLGRTNLPDFGLRWHTDNALHGPTRNPWDLSRTPGGSTGGEAAALATGMTPFGLGNDLGGSLRVPSAFCGTAALKPTYGRIPQASSLPGPDPFLSVQLMAVQGPMARHVRDLRVGLEVMAGPDPRDPLSLPVPLEGKPVPRPIRVAVVTDPDAVGTDPAVAEAVRRAADALADAGYALEETEPPRLGEARDLWASILFTESQALWPLMEPFASDDARRMLNLSFESRPATDVGGVVRSHMTRHEILRAWWAFHADYPLILGPVCTQPPFEVGYDLRGTAEADDLVRRFTLTVAANLLGLPAVALPAGVTDGLPQGVQIVGAAYREDLCLDAGEAIEERLGVVTPIDPHG